MTQRITAKHLEAKVDILNGMLGYDSPAYNTIGALQLSGAYGGYAVHLVCNEFGGVSDLTYGHYPAREIERFLSGMLAGARLFGAS